METRESRDQCEAETLNWAHCRATQVSDIQLIDLRRVCELDLSGLEPLNQGLVQLIAMVLVL